MPKDYDRRTRSAATRPGRGAPPCRGGLDLLAPGREPCDDLLPMIGRDTPWKAMLGKDERDATEEEIAALGPSTGRSCRQTARDRQCPYGGAVPASCAAVTHESRQPPYNV